MSDVEKELREDELREDGRAWREQVGAPRTDLTPRPARSRTRVYLGGLAAAAVVVALAVVVLALRHPSQHTDGRVAAGREQGSTAVRTPGAPTSFPSRPGWGPPPPPPPPQHHLVHVPQHVKCPTGSAGMGFAASIAGDAHGYSSPQAAADHSGYGNPHAAWQVVARDHDSALLQQPSVYLHVIRLKDGSWLVDSGGSCGDANPSAPR